MFASSASSASSHFVSFVASSVFILESSKTSVREALKGQNAMETS
jgi:hypothetical protein